MAKPKSPLLSLGARGTIGDTLTYQKRGQDTITREKPMPTYRRTLPQTYQRWLYQDYAYRWTQQSEATKRQYAADGSRFHLTGFQYWMKYQLTNLPDIAAMYHLDYISGMQVIDSSKNANNGTVFGASLVDSIIDKALSLDGIDDYVRVAAHPSLGGMTVISVEAWIYLNAYNPANYSPIVEARGVITNYTYEPTIHNNGKAYTWINGHVIASQGTYPIQEWIHFVCTYDSVSKEFRYYKNAVLDAGSPLAADYGAIDDIQWLNIGHGLGNRYHNGIIDEVRIYNRILDATEVLRHSERRYP